jgi:predicted GIY-YIG superfamily endonuclease
MGGYVYLIHLDAPLNAKHAARHYIGWAFNLSSRMQQHLTGRGARFMQVAKERGISWSIARVWPGDRHFERRLKKRKEAPRLCPIYRRAHDPRQLKMDLQEDYPL